MASKEVTTAREALMAELLRDVDGLIARFEQAEQSLGARVEQATRDAAGQAFLAAKFNFESMIPDQERRLVEAGRHAAALIGNQLSESGTILNGLAFELQTRRKGLLLLVAVVSLMAGAIGALVVVKLVGIV